MTTIELICTGASARARVDGRITRGMVGLAVDIRCDESWDGLSRTLVCRNGSEEPWVLPLVESKAVIPWEVLQLEGELFLSLEGRNEDGCLVLPTSWASCGLIYDSGSGALDPAVPTPSQIEQLLILAHEAVSSARQAKETARSVSEAAGSGLYDGKSPYIDDSGWWMVWREGQWVNSGWMAGSRTDGGAYDDRELRQLIAGKYVRPADGIPMEDLSPEIQDILVRIEDTGAALEWLARRGEAVSA